MKTTALQTKSNLSFIQHFTKGANPCPDGIKIGHCQFQINKRNGDIHLFKMLHELGSVKGIRLAKFNVPEQHPVGSALLDSIE